MRLFRGIIETLELLANEQNNNLPYVIADLSTNGKSGERPPKNVIADVFRNLDFATLMFNLRRRRQEIAEQVRNDTRKVVVTLVC